LNFFLCLPGSYHRLSKRLLTTEEASRRYFDILSRNSASHLPSNGKDCSSSGGRGLLDPGGSVQGRCEGEGCMVGEGSYFVSAPVGNGRTKGKKTDEGSLFPSSFEFSFRLSSTSPPSSTSQAKPISSGWLRYDIRSKIMGSGGLFHSDLTDEKRMVVSCELKLTRRRPLLFSLSH